MSVRRNVFTTLVWMSLLSTTARAQSSSEADALGWGEETLESAPELQGSSDSSDPSAPDTRKIELSLDGFLRSDWALWTRRLESNPFAKARQSLDLAFRLRTKYLRFVAEGHIAYDLAYRVEREDYDPATLDAYEFLIRSHEVYLALDGGAFSIAFGRQIVAYGSGELLSVLDVINPRDLREPGLANLEDLRLPILMTRIDWSGERQRLELIAVHEAWYGLRPPPFGTYSFLRELVFEDPVLGPLIDLAEMTTGTSRNDWDVTYRDTPDRYSKKAQQAFARYIYSGSRIELGVYVASLLEAPGVQTGTLDGAAIGMPPIEFALPLNHPRYTMVGISGAVPKGDWLVHWELALDIHRPVQLAEFVALPSTSGFAVDRRTLLRWLTGLRYSGIPDGVISIEYTQGTRDDGGSSLALPALLPINPQVVALRWSQDFMRERLETEIVASFIGPKFRGGGFVRAQLIYKVRDELGLTFGYVTYYEGEVRSFLSGFDSHDRFFFRLRWDFSLI